MPSSLVCFDFQERRREAAGRPGSAVVPEDVWLSLGALLRLSPRELQVVRGVFEDHKEETIACDLGISPHTVNTYFQRLYTKLGVSSRPQLILRVMAEYLALQSRTVSAHS